MYPYLTLLQNTVSRFSTFMSASSNQGKTTFDWYNEHYQSLFQVVFRQVSCNALTQDILQELYLKLAKIPQSTVITNPKNYLIQMACRLVIDHQRVKDNQVKTDQEHNLGNIICPQGKPESNTINQNLLKNIHFALKKLPQDKRDIIWLSAVEGWNYQKIAAHKGRSVSWVEKSMAQGMVLLTELKRQTDGLSS